MSNENTKEERPIAVVLLSGGLDSMVTAALAKEQGFAVRALTVDYGQRHRLELASAKRIAEELALEAQVEIALDLRAFGGSALTDAIDVPKSGGLRVRVSIARNWAMISRSRTFQLETLYSSR